MRIILSKIHQFLAKFVALKRTFDFYDSFNLTVSNIIISAFLIKISEQFLVDLKKIKLHVQQKFGQTLTTILLYGFQHQSLSGSD